MGKHNYQVVTHSTLKLPAECKDMGCFGRGSGGYCKATTEDCTSRGEFAAGWYSNCGWSNCITGWQVRCVKCDPGYKFKVVERPTVVKVVKRWVAPVLKVVEKTVKTVKEEAAKISSTIKIGAIGADEAMKYDSTASASEAMKGAALAIKASIAELAGFKAVLCNATKLKEGLEYNITWFTHKEKDLADKALKERAAAVRFAKKRVLANITMMRAKRAMDDAFMGEHGAEDGAKRAVEFSKNAKDRKVYNKKLLIDQLESVKKAEAMVRVGQLAVNKAFSQLAMAKSSYYKYQLLTKKDNSKEKYLVKLNSDLGEKLALKKAMEKAYADSSPAWGLESDYTRNNSNVPTWGEGDEAVGFGVMLGSCPCSGQKGCHCSEEEKTEEVSE